MKIICVCKHCGEHDSNDPTIELNFQEGKIFYYCQKCREVGRNGLNEISMVQEQPKHVSLPRSRRIGG